MKKDIPRQVPLIPPGMDPRNARAATTTAAHAHQQLHIADALRVLQPIPQKPGLLSRQFGQDEAELRPQEPSSPTGRVLVQALEAHDWRQAQEAPASVGLIAAAHAELALANAAVGGLDVDGEGEETEEADAPLRAPEKSPAISPPDYPIRDTQTPASEQRS